MIVAGEEKKEPDAVVARLLPRSTLTVMIADMMDDGAVRHDGVQRGHDRSFARPTK
jgi:hypothetical protein